MENMIGKGRLAIDMIVDPGSFVENQLPNFSLPCADYAPGAVIGTARLDGGEATVIAIDAMVANPRFKVVYAGIIGLEEGYKMAMAVYRTMEADATRPLSEKRPLLLIVDTPGNGPGKLEEIVGMNKSTGAYQLALAEARKAGHPVLAVVIGRAISGAFLCHGLQADQILSLSSKFNTMIHVMPLTSIARITKQDLERLTELSKSNPVFAAGPDFFYRLGGVEEIIEAPEAMRECVLRHVAEIKQLKADGRSDRLGPWGRGELGDERGGRVTRKKVMARMNEQFDAVAERYLNG
jgi:malonate decarboxylase gamma subunit